MATVENANGEPVANPAPAAKVRRTSTKKGKKEQPNYLVFVDTNVLLDLYRSRSDITQRRLEKLLEQKDRVITTDQLHDEFRRNRLSAMEEGLKALQVKVEKGAIPSVFRGLAVAKAYEKAYDSYKAKQAKLVAKLEAMMDDPAKDPVASMLKKLFTTPTANHLDAEDEAVFGPILAKAERRMLLGNPPRKKDDPSIGDAINWEWCLRVCAENSADLVIVTRDGDYGRQLKGGTRANTFLSDEFKARVSQKRKLVITSGITDALKLLGEKVTKADIKAEREEAAAIPREKNSAIAAPLLPMPDKEFHQWLEQMLAIAKESGAAPNPSDSEA